MESSKQKEKDNAIHTPVLLEEATKLLLGNSGRLYVDCTLGLGGHTKRILEENPKAFVVAIDRDEEAIELAKENLKEFEGSFVLYKANFIDLDLVLKEEGIEKVDGFLFDLGVSMLQLKSERGFSFQRDDFLDMRMDKEQNLTAYKVVSEYPERELARILWEYGEEKLSRKIAKVIVQRRKEKPIQTTKELAELIASLYPPKLRHGRVHPATRTFQAIRMEVNKELESLKEALEKVPEFLKPGGRLVVISFHSLEDRLVKRFFREHDFKVLTKKPITPSEEEVKLNPASRSAKLRAGEKL